MLSERGIEEAHALAEVARGWGLEAVYSSAERKAQATALVVGDAVGHAVRIVDGLQELRFDRWIANADAFAETIRDIFDQPAVSVHGAERASAAAARFEAGVRIIEDGPFPAAVVSHGRVLTAYLTHLLRLDDPLELWRSIPMPGWACVDIEPPVPKLVEAFQGLDEAL